MENQDLPQTYRIGMRFDTLKYLNAEGMWIKSLT